MNNENQKLEELVERKILEAKLIIAEKRLLYALTIGAALLSLFGVIVPIWITSSSSKLSEKELEAMQSKVDQSILGMENRFQELAGQLRTPTLSCFFDDRELGGAVLTFESNVSKTVDVRLINTGTGPAEKIRIRLYISKAEEELGGISYDSVWEKQESSDEPGYPVMLQRVFGNKGYDLDRLNAKDSVPLPIYNLNFQNFKDSPVPVLLKLYYGQSEPKRIQFTVMVESQRVPRL